jgi:hypothetical protein
MAFFADLTPHTYSPTCGLNVLNVGWLDEGKEFPKGPTSDEFKIALKDLCSHPIILHRGFHGCYFCLVEHRANPVACGNGQIRVIDSNKVWYAAPTLLYHYVTDHQYLPPAEFVRAVICPLAIGTDIGWLEFNKSKDGLYLSP